MNTFYFFENDIYEKKEQAEKAARNFKIKHIDEIETDKDFNTFYNDYRACREEGNSCLDSIEWAK